jgi:outer membrane biosynthesis protein TonB
MGAGASVGQLSELPEEEVVAHLTALYQQDPEKIERIFSTASSKAKVSKEAAPPTEEKAAEEPAAEAPKAPEPEPAPEEEKPKEDPKPSAAPEEAPTAAGTTHEERSEKAAEPEAPGAPESHATPVSSALVGMTEAVHILSRSRTARSRPGTGTSTCVR